MIIDVGTKPNDVTLSWENLFSYNRKILDAASNRYFFVADPVELKVLERAENLPSQTSPAP